MEIKGNVDLGKIFETAANTTKTLANLTDEGKKQNRNNSKPIKSGDTNQQHQQTVEVHVGSDQKEMPKPVIVREKPETHIHKHFPDNRALTPEECKLEETRLQYEYTDKERERIFRQKMEERDRADRKEREEYERRERIRKEEERRQQRKIRNMVCGGIGAALLGLTAYYCYTDSRNRAGRGDYPKIEGSAVKPVQAEGKVE